MPKIVSSSTVSSSEQINVRPEQHLHVYYCLCSEFILVIGKIRFMRLVYKRMQSDYSIQMKTLG